MRKLILIFIALAVATPSALANVDMAPAMVPLAQASDLEAKGEYLEAQKIYESILQGPGLSAIRAQAVRTRYESLNWKLLLSRTETPGSAFHTVAPGDSLYVIARKYKTTVGLIKKTNGLQRDTIYPNMKLKVHTGSFTVTVDKSENMLYVYFQGKPVRHYRVATGKNNGTPTGEFKIVNKLVNPTWFRSGAIVAPDSPDNILGTRWMGFDYAGYGIHGTTIPESIGTQATAGCVRMLNSEVEELYDLLPRQTKVTVVD